MMCPSIASEDVSLQLTYKAQGGDTVTMFLISSSQREKHSFAIGADSLKMCIRAFLHSFAIGADFLKMCIRAFLRAKYMF